MGRIQNNNRLAEQTTIPICTPNMGMNHRFHVTINRGDPLHTIKIKMFEAYSRFIQATFQEQPYGSENTLYLYWPEYDTIFTETQHPIYTVAEFWQNVRNVSCIVFH